MTNKELSIVLRELACGQKTPLCKEWTEAWEDDCDIDTLLDKYVRGFDFCIKNDYPPLDFCRKHFKKEDLHRHHIYLDEEVDIRDAESGTWIFLGNSSGEMTFRNFSVGTVYLRHNTNMKIVAKGFSKVFMSQYDDACAETIPLDSAVIKRYDRRK